MELPHLGKTCNQSGCLEKNDFLLLKCGYCKIEYCNSHSKARDSAESAKNEGGHYCKSIPLDARTITCPVCKQIVPVARNQDPDLIVNQHISRGCPQVEEKKVFKNECSFKGCKKKELIPIQCQICLLSYCIKHRLEQDHSCTGPPPSTSIFSSFTSNLSGKPSKSKPPQSNKKKDDCLIS